MSDEVIILQCSPTLAGLKAGSLFSTPCDDVPALLERLRQLNGSLGPNGLRLLPMKMGGSRALIYLYRPDLLSRDLADGQAQALLHRLGYLTQEPERCLHQLIRRLREQSEFPHEIGLFLGYPAEDVEGFITNRAKGYKLVGCWKVYGDVPRAQRLFRQYARCTHAYYSHWRQGKSLTHLAAAPFWKG